MIRHSKKQFSFLHQALQNCLLTFMSRLFSSQHDVPQRSAYIVCQQKFILSMWIC